MTSSAAPFEPGELEPYLARLEAGEPFKPVLEELLNAQPFQRAEELGLILREGRGSWLPLLRSGGGEALYVGNALSGTVHVLAALGFRPTVYDVSEERLRFERFRSEALVGVTPRIVVAENGARLPFDDDAFQLVVQEAGTPGPPGGWRHGLGELRRVSHGEVVVTANNRLGYKRSLGRRGRFRVLSPLRFAKAALFASGEERTLRGYRKALRFEGCAPVRALALYPHSADFTHVVALDDPAPRLHIGPKERQNALKMAAHRLGLFPLLAPSYALISEDAGLRAASAPRIERALDELAQRTGEARPEIDEWIASRGNCVVLQTRAPAGAGDEGRWCVHIALGPHKHAQVERHDRVIRELWERGQPVPVPEPIWAGVVEGLHLTCERRLHGLAAPQRSGETPIMRRMLDDVAEHFTRLVEEPAQELDARDFRRHFDWRFDIVTQHAARPETKRQLERMRDETRERVLGRAMPLVLQHADLRSKHVQIDDDGGVLGFLDWGSSRSLDVPYFDLLQLLVHEEKQAYGGQVGDAWRRLFVEGEPRDWERAALDRYARAIGLDADVARAIELAFPVFVAAMAESNWDYSRPHWVHLSFGL